MTKENKDKIELTPAEDNPWYKFFLAAANLDEEKNLMYGFSWFFGFYYLNEEFNKLSFSLQKIQKELSDEHWLNKLPFKDLEAIGANIKEYLFPLLEVLYKELGSPQAIHIINFSKLSFNKNVNFSSSVFPIMVSFSGSDFLKDVNFGMATFHNVAFFNGTKFRGDVLFVLANFFESTEFDNATFFKDVKFATASFVVVGFGKTTFSSDVNFSRTDFSGIVSFKRAIFSGYVRFNSVTFAEGAIFDDAKFDIHAPFFFGAKIKSEITWHRTEWPRPNKTTEQGIIIKNQDAYENLATKMKELDKYHDEHSFYREGMHCRRYIEKNRLIRCAFWLYEKLANYGYGVERAFTAWGVHIVVGGLILFALRYFYGISNFINDAGCALGVSLANSHGFFFMGERLNDCYGSFKDLPFFTAIWVTQTVFGVLLLFLFLLTLRVRFRLK